MDDGNRVTIPAIFCHLNNSTDLRLFYTSMSLTEFAPDFAITLLKENDKTKAEALAIKLLDTLKGVGLLVQVRAGNANEGPTVFVKASHAAIVKALEQDELKQWLTAAEKGTDSGAATESPDPSAATRIRICYDLIRSVVTPGLPEWSFVKQISPIHDSEWTKRLKTTILKRFLLSDHDIIEIKNQWGERVGFYFYFLRFYFYWSLAPSAFGLICNFLFGGYSSVFAAFNVLWAAVFIQAWKFEQKKVSLKWGTKGSSGVFVANPKFKAVEVIEDPVTGEKVPYYPAWKRALKQVSFIPVAALSVAIATGLVFLAFALELFVAHLYAGPFKGVLALIPTIAVIAYVQIATAIYTQIVGYFSAWENYRSEEEVELANTQKSFALVFVAQFAGLLLTVFIYKPFGKELLPHLDVIKRGCDSVAGRFYQVQVHDHSQVSLNAERLSAQVFYFTVTAQVVGIVVENLVPFLVKQVTIFLYKRKVGEVKYSDDATEKKYLEAVRDQSFAAVYSVDDDYRQIAVLFGYVVMFGAVWPLAPVAATIFVWIQMKTDFLKICNLMKRPLPRQVESIAPWDLNLSILAWIGSFMSSSIVALYSVPKPYNTGLIGTLIVLVTEHVYLAVSYLSSWFLSIFDAGLDAPSRSLLKQELTKRKQEILSKRSVTASESEPVIDVQSQLEKALAEPRKITSPKSKKAE